MLTLLHQEVQIDKIEKLVREAAGDLELSTFDHQRLPHLDPGTTVLAYLPDGAMAQFLPEAAKQGWRVGLLPHPHGRVTRASFGLASSLSDAIADIVTAERDVHVDLLECNGRTVLGSAVAGDPLTTPTASNKSVRALVRQIRSLLHASPMVLNLRTARDQQVRVAALGIVVVEHAHSAVLTRRLIDDTVADDGMCHALVYAPRSVLVMLAFALLSLVSRCKGSRLPPFVGYIKSASISIECGHPMRVAIDDYVETSTTAVLSVARGALKLIPGRHLNVAESQAEVKEVFRMKGLLDAEVLDSGRLKHLPLISRASPDDFKALFEQLRTSAQTSESFVTLMILSTLLATFGLFADSAPVIIGAMILAPLMAPIVAVAMGVLRTNETVLLRSSLRTFGIGIGLALGCAVGLTMLTPLNSVNSEIAARLNPTLLDMAVAVISGVAGAYAHARASVARSLAGVAIAVALVPPLAVTGIGIGWASREIVLGAGLLFLTNFVGMVLAAAATFLVLGYSPYRVSRRGLGISGVAVLVVSILLIPGFVRMVDKHNLIRRLDGWNVNGYELREVSVHFAKPMRVGLTVLAERPLEEAAIDEIKTAMVERLGRPLTLEARVVIVR